MITNDKTYVWSLACSCLLLEEDARPATLNVGTATEPRMLPRREALRDLYSRLLIEALGADAQRLATLADQTRAALAEMHEPDYWQRLYDKRKSGGDSSAGDALTEAGQREVRETHVCALDLCDGALAMVRESGAADDEATRQRFLAGLNHANNSDVLGAISPATVQDSSVRLTERLSELDL
jgi:hypothetical protein